MIRVGSIVEITSGKWIKSRGHIEAINWYAKTARIVIIALGKELHLDKRFTQLEVVE